MDNYYKFINIKKNGNEDNKINIKEYKFSSDNKNEIMKFMDNFGNIKIVDKYILFSNDKSSNDYFTLKEPSSNIETIKDSKKNFINFNQNNNNYSKIENNSINNQDLENEMNANKNTNMEII